MITRNVNFSILSSDSTEVIVGKVLTAIQASVNNANIFTRHSQNVSVGVECLIQNGGQVYFGPQYPGISNASVWQEFTVPNVFVLEDKSTIVYRTIDEMFIRLNAIGACIVDLSADKVSPGIYLVKTQFDQIPSDALAALEDLGVHIGYWSTTASGSLGSKQKLRFPLIDGYTGSGVRPWKSIMSGYSGTNFVIGPQVASVFSANGGSHVAIDTLTISASNVHPDGPAIKGMEMSWPMSRGYLNLRDSQGNNVRQIEYERVSAPSMEYVYNTSVDGSGDDETATHSCSNLGLLNSGVIDIFNQPDVSSVMSYMTFARVIADIGGDITSIQDAVANINGEIIDLNTAISGEIMTRQENVDQLRSSVTDLDQDVTSLDTRVTALEETSPGAEDYDSLYVRG